MRALVFDAYGDPKSVLTVRDIPTPVPARGQVLIKMDASPINPSDLIFVEGDYGFRKPLPCVPGFEGAGTVVAANAGPYGRWLMGKRVACGAPEDGQGTWAEYMVCGAFTVAPLRAGTSSDFGATVLANPISAVSLVAMAQRHKAAAFIQTAAGSALGKMLARWARHEGLPGIHVVRSGAAASALRAAGETHVLVSTEAGFDGRLKALAHDLKAMIAFDAVGGEMTAQLGKAMPHGGRVVIYGGLSGDEATVDIAETVFQAKSVEGFWLPLEMKRLGALGLLSRIRTVQQAGEAMFGTPVLARLPFERIGEALDLQPRGTEGKVLLTP